LKTCIKDSFRLPVLGVALGLALTGRLTAQTFTILHSFAGTDGGNPSGSLILSGKTLYGTTAGGGSAGGVPTIFAIDVDGTRFTNLYSFIRSNGGSTAGLIVSGSKLYGTEFQGGSAGVGNVFAVNTDGTGFTNIHSFTAFSIPGSINKDGFWPRGKLILSGNSLYGTAQEGGSFGRGTVFRVNTDGSGFTTLHSFTEYHGPFPNGPYTNNEGAEPMTGLILSDNTLYGAAIDAGGWGGGTVFATSTNGADFRNLHSFSAIGPINENGDGAWPQAKLILSGGTLYGTAAVGGSSGLGTVFAVNTDGTGFTNLHTFTGGSDGRNPSSELIIMDNTLYGTLGEGGDYSYGTVFAVHTDGSGFTTLYSFGGGSDGSYPSSGLLLRGNTLYGTTAGGGASDNGTVFSIAFSPQLALNRSGTNIGLSWPTNYNGFDYTGYTLQSTTNLASPTVWTTVFPGPEVVSGQNTVSNLLSATQQFYRLAE
jgi:uncharacterized repeat protein (TIGR03803 family)